jgi:hypothetical protein
MSPPKDKIIEPIPDKFDNVAEAILKPATTKNNKINALEANTALQPAGPVQGVLDLGIEVERDVNGIEMGVLENGIPFLTQRGLAELTGASRKEIYDITQQWEKHFDDSVLGKDRIAFIREYLFRHGYQERQLYIETKKDGTPHYAYPDIVCMAVLEYYAFESKSKNDTAVANYRKLAAYGLQRFIYDALGYSPDQKMLDSWRHFHDRLDMTLDSVPTGYFSVFREIASMLVPMIRAGIIISDKVVPDISVGKAWSEYWKEQDLAATHGERTKYDHDYPLYYPQAKSNPQPSFAYPDSALGVFRAWLRQHYITSKFPKYLMGQTKLGKLAVQTATKVIETFTPKQITKK